MWLRRICSENICQNFFSLVNSSQLRYHFSVCPSFYTTLLLHLSKISLGLQSVGNICMLLHSIPLSTAVIALSSFWNYFIGLFWAEGTVPRTCFQKYTEQRINIGTRCRNRNLAVQNWVETKEHKYGRYLARFRASPWAWCRGMHELVIIYM